MQLFLECAAFNGIIQLGMTEQDRQLQSEEIIDPSFKRQNNSFEEFMQQNKISQLDYALYRYEAALVEIEKVNQYDTVKLFYLTKKGRETKKYRKVNTNSSPELILDVLIARDNVQAALTKLTQIPNRRAIAVTRLDTRLKKRNRSGGTAISRQ